MKNEKARWRKSQNVRRLAFKILLATLKEGKPCKDCELFYPAYVMQFDHIFGRKEFSVGKWLSQSGNAELLKDELDKCDIVCSNCHAIRSYFRTYKQGMPNVE